LCADSIILELLVWLFIISTRRPCCFIRVFATLANGDKCGNIGEAKKEAGLRYIDPIPVAIFQPYKARTLHMRHNHTQIHLDTHTPVCSPVCCR